ncbi:hypothetical protein X798_00121 [Onchocerca flexuosa]|uniref:THAP-type domain-containing protein n=2 Tax=Onchocerca flexuosa TaxID=387005 RepID=A0A183H506_9BILA|nr:hypothetical protein X798_00121 [Onchocerca flexuosa]VDO33444.1 unnamed protein product [Onchocerca flexuosa]
MTSGCFDFESCYDMMETSSLFVGKADHAKKEIIPETEKDSYNIFHTIKRRHKQLGDAILKTPFNKVMSNYQKTPSLTVSDYFLLNITDIEISLPRRIN